MPITDPKKIEEVLTRGVEAIYPAVAVLRKKMIAGKGLSCIAATTLPVLLCISVI